MPSPVLMPPPSAIPLPTTEPIWFQVQAVIVLVTVVGLPTWMHCGHAVQTELFYSFLLLRISKYPAV